MADTERKYDIVLLGASGYTGTLTAKHIASFAPKKIKWAIAGRSQKKLEALLVELRTSKAPSLPSIELAELSSTDLLALSSKTHVLINTVGPFYRYGEPVVSSCVKTKTHYLDVTGEVPWVLSMIRKYDSAARERGVVLGCQFGLESVPSDLLAYTLVNYIRDEYDLPTREVVNAFCDFKLSPSGGTLATLSLVEHYSIKELMEASRPWSLSPLPGQHTPKSLTQTILGIRRYPGLGTLTSSNLTSGPNIAMVERSWGLHEQVNGGTSSYGPKFTFAEMARASNFLTGILWYYFEIFLLLMIALKPVRWAIQKLNPVGLGPSDEFNASSHLELRAVGTADTGERNEKTPKRAMARMEFRGGGGYDLTAITIGEAAFVLVEETDTLAQKIGGFISPATLGDKYVERIKKTSIKLEVGPLPS